MRFPLACLLVATCALAACAGPPPAAPAEPLPGDLTSAQDRQLRDLGVPVLVPGVLGAFRLGVFEIGQGAAAASYRLDYRRPDGACFQVSGSTDGRPGPDYPLAYTEVPIPAVDGQPVVRVYEAADDPLATSAQVWGVGAIVSEVLEKDGMTVQFLSDTVGGCRPVSLAEGAALVAGLQPLDAPPPSAPGAPADLGAFAPAPDVTGTYNAASSPEAAAEAVARRYAAERTTVEVLDVVAGRAVVLVTATGLGDDSVRDERLRLVYAEDGFGMWELAEAGRQVRCHPGRGHTDWGAERCL